MYGPQPAVLFALYRYLHVHVISSAFNIKQDKLLLCHY